MKNLNFYFDFLSPFSYFSWINHKKELSQHNINIVYRPVLMGRLFTQHGFPGPGEIKAKRNYELKKCFRYASKNNIPFCPPSRFPFNPMAIIRLGLTQVSQEEQFKVIDMIFKEIWQKGQVLEDPELINELFSKHNFSSDIIAKSFAKEAKQELKQNIKSALDIGIFGVPSFAIDEEFFWGNDSFGDLNDYLNQNDNWNKKLYNEVLSNNPL